MTGQYLNAYRYHFVILIGGSSASYNQSMTDRPKLKSIPTLTSKQELFCQEYVKGNSASDAYRKIYNVKQGTKDSTVHRSAHELLNNPKISSRVQSLTARKEQNLQTSVHSLSRYIVERLVEETKGDNPSSRLKALELLGKHREIDIFNPESKVNVTVNNNKTTSELEAEIKEKLKLVISD